jgi:ATP adenylyltransferase
MDYLFNPEKIKYVKGEKPKVACILCALRDRDPAVTSLEVFRGGGCIVSVNLYPFNPGHVMVFPERHIASPVQLTEREAGSMHRLLCLTLQAIEAEFGPAGFNVGYNLGGGSGASIPHLHQHIVPRYENEVGFLDVLAGTRVMVVDPAVVMERLKARFAGISGAF